MRIEVSSLAAPSVADTITDFTVGLGGDVLDLDDLLPAGAHNGSGTNVLDDYIDFEPDGSNTTILIDHDGGGTFQPTMQITIEGVDLASNGVLSDAEIIQSLISTGNLVT